MRFSPSSFIIFCLFRSTFTLGFLWGGSLADGGGGGVCWVGSLHARLHISHASAGPVLAKVQNWQIHCGGGWKEAGDLKPETSGATGGRVARRGRSHTSQRTLLPWFMTVQLLHCHSGVRGKTLHQLPYSLV